MSDSSKTLTIGSAEQLWQPATRRSFLRMLGVGGTVVLARRRPEVPRNARAPKRSVYAPVCTTTSAPVTIATSSASGRVP